MKKKMNNKVLTSIIGAVIEFIWIVTAIGVFKFFYDMLKVPPESQVIDVMRYYNFWGYTNVPETTLNTIMGLSVFVLIITVPLLVMNIKNIKIMIKSSYERETGWYQIIAGVLTLMTCNIFTAVLYLYSGITILKEKPKVKVKFKNDDFKDDKDVLIQTILKVILFVLLIFFALIIIVPFYWMILTSLMSKAEYSNFTDIKLYLSLPQMWWINFKEALTRANFSLYIQNTLTVAFWTTAGTVITTIIAAFAFSKLEFKGRDLLFSIFLMTMMVPGELYVITNFVTVSNTFNWYNTFYAMIVPFVASIFYIFFLRQTFKQVPDSLYKAAKVDGCSDFKFLTRVMVPIAIPTLITITILSALGSWNAYIWPRLVSEEDHFLVSIALRTSFTQADTGMPDFRLQMAAATIVTVPILILFLFARKYIMRGVGRSGTKG